MIENILEERSHFVGVATPRLSSVANISGSCDTRFDRISVYLLELTQSLMHPCKYKLRSLDDVLDAGNNSI